jgi:hypothetical protein
MPAVCATSPKSLPPSKLGAGAAQGRLHREHLAGAVRRWSWFSPRICSRRTGSQRELAGNQTTRRQPHWSARRRHHGPARESAPCLVCKLGIDRAFTDPGATWPDGSPGERSGDGARRAARRRCVPKGVECRHRAHRHDPREESAALHASFPTSSCGSQAPMIKVEDGVELPEILSRRADSHPWLTKASGCSISACIRRRTGSAGLEVCRNRPSSGSARSSVLQRATSAPPKSCWLGWQQDTRLRIQRL